MTGLNRKDADLANLECIVLGKGNKERTVYISQVGGGMLLESYFKERTDKNEALFIGKGSSRLTPGGIRLILKKPEAESKIHHIHPHKFRRTLATNLIRHGMQIQEVANILGHEKLDTTMKYIRLIKSDLKYSYQKYS